MLNKKCQGIPPTDILVCLVIDNCFFYDVYMEDIDDRKFQLHHLHLEQYFIQQNMIKVSDIYVRITVSILQFVYISWGR